MSDTRYPTRMHEVLGVEPYERFSVSSTTPWYGLWLFVDEYGDVREEGLKHPLDRAAVFLVNHPDRIIRKPRLSEEQVAQLKALVTLGYRWLVKDMTGDAFAFGFKPVKHSDWMAWMLSPDDKNEMVVALNKNLNACTLVSWSDPEPFDIGKALGVGE